MKVQVNSIEFVGSKKDVESDESENLSYPKDTPADKPSPYDYMPKPEPKPIPFENVSNHNGIIDDDLPF